MKRTALAAASAQLPLMNTPTKAAQTKTTDKTAAVDHAFLARTGAALRWLEGEAPAFNAGVTWGVA